MPPCMTDFEAETGNNSESLETPLDWKVKLSLTTGIVSEKSRSHFNNLPLAKYGISEHK